jgi:pyruvate/2-oxoglutarate dehydrogenase complex dihydrolipoamide acyltransferase (E2) component
MATPILMPSVGMFTTEGTLSAWLRPSGAAVQEGEPVCEFTTEKTTQEIGAPVAGIVHHVVTEGTSVAVSGLLGYILAEGEIAPERASPPPPSPPEVERGRPPTPLSTSGGEGPGVRPVPSTPIARRIAAENQIDLSQVTGSGPGGRIVEADALAAIARRQAAPAAAAAPARPSGHRVRERIPLTGIRQTIARRLQASHQQTAPVTLTREVDAERLVVAQARLSEHYAVSVPYDAIFMKILAAALRERPELNATIEGEEIVVFEDIDVGFAVATSGPRGSILLVPVVRSAATRPLAELAPAVRELAGRARASQLTPDELSGGTITITNLGAFGVDGFTPIINPPQSAILGIGRIAARPVARDGQLVVGQTCVLSLTFDHRVTDGVPAAQLLDAIAKLMQDEAFLSSL